MKSWPSSQGSGQPEQFTVLGVDPGSLVTGYGLVRKSPSGLECIDFGCLRPARGQSLGKRLEEIHDRLADVIHSFRPDRIAVETIFHSRSVRAALTMGHVRGVVLLAAAKAGLEIFEYTPLEVKLSVTGTGAASKKQVQFMVRETLSPQGRLPLDASDALAVALCHINRTGKGQYDILAQRHST
ncbi:MAG: crossover junction endodeoxyribonuclease RuvC [Candidatus Eiseniibacteriota bacterium]|nr:MAG: crossover junction endodeoxyribonuclease RuvC [Candidatus Eisenbacteria bacterium]